jgi:hypothetical protein
MGNQFTMTPAAAPAQGMTLQEARKWVRFYARDAAGSKSAYQDEDVDRALAAVGEQFCRVTTCNRRADSVAIAAGDAAVDLASLGAGFHPERVVSAMVVGSACALRRPTWADLQRKAAECPAPGRPAEIAWEAPGGAQVWPTPDADYTLKVQWWEPFTTWTPGVDDATAATITLNCRPDYLVQWLPFGPTAMLQHNEPDMAYASESWQKYLAVEAKLRGAGALGARTLTRRKACW